MFLYNLNYGLDLSLLIVLDTIVSIDLLYSILHALVHFALHLLTNDNVLLHIYWQKVGGQCKNINTNLNTVPASDFYLLSEILNLIYDAQNVSRETIFSRFLFLLTLYLQTILSDPRPVCLADCVWRMFDPFRIFALLPRLTMPSSGQFVIISHSQGIDTHLISSWLLPPPTHWKVKFKINPELLYIALLLDSNQWTTMKQVWNGEVPSN